MKTFLDVKAIKMLVVTKQVASDEHTNILFFISFVCPCVTFKISHGKDNILDSLQTV